ncbi:hypothetical protein RhiJN_08547 [Ceratobasidium sp. AG-Ba]|nr:hypothetical protein RhiJN_08547 [Ceratobasidium sp. AG-Ba]QRW09333.1 hypothetical protein RhiLY_08332 [Ceratobasidium sp. AG-Ba]
MRNLPIGYEIFIQYVPNIPEGIKKAPNEQRGLNASTKNGLNEPLEGRPGKGREVFYYQSWRLVEAGEYIHILYIPRWEDYDSEDIVEPGFYADSQAPGTSVILGEASDFIIKTFCDAPGGIIVTIHPKGDMDDQQYLVGLGENNKVGNIITKAFNALSSTELCLIQLEIMGFPHDQETGLPGWYLPAQFE